VHAWRKATAHLVELKGQDADRAPMAVIHSACYAMFHAARAGVVPCDRRGAAQA
jgi:hypothetical protein